MFVIMGTLPAFSVHVKEDYKVLFGILYGVLTPNWQKAKKKITIVPPYFACPQPPCTPSGIQGSVHMRNRKECNKLFGCRYAAKVSVVGRRHEASAF